MDQRVVRRVRNVGTLRSAAANAVANVASLWRSTGRVADSPLAYAVNAGERGRLAARPGNFADPGPVGMQQLDLGPIGGGVVYVPQSYRPDSPSPLILMLHGAGADGLAGLQPLLKLADQTATIILAPDAQGRTWDAVQGGFGPDVALIDEALALVFSRYIVDPSRIAAGGFSDGATYALSLGITNGGLFTHVLAFSPGFMAPAGQESRPRIFVSHGINDPVLPVQLCSWQIVAELRRAGYEVVYREFNGRHSLPREIVRSAMDWFLGRPERKRGVVQPQSRPDMNSSQDSVEQQF